MKTKPNLYQRLRRRTIATEITFTIDPRHIGVIALALDDRIHKLVKRGGIGGPPYHAAMQAREAVATLQLQLAETRR